MFEEQSFFSTVGKVRLSAGIIERSDLCKMCFKQTTLTSSLQNVDIEICFVWFYDIIILRKKVTVDNVDKDLKFVRANWHK